MQPGDVAKIVISALLFLFLVFMGTQIYVYASKAQDAGAAYASAKARLEETQKDHDKLQADLHYYSDPANLEKELKARFNYHLPGERTLILVPQQP